jgi:hypothetical protein
MPKLTWVQDTKNPNIHMRCITTDEKHIVRLIDIDTPYDEIKKMETGFDNDGNYCIPYVYIDASKLREYSLNIAKKNINQLISRFLKNPGTYTINLMKWNTELLNAVSWELRITSPPKSKETPKNKSKTDAPTDLVNMLTNKLNILEKKMDLLLSKEISPKLNARELESEKELDSESESERDSESDESDDEPSWDETIKIEMDNLLGAIKDFSGFDTLEYGTPEIRVVSVIEILKGLMSRNISYKDLNNEMGFAPCLNDVPRFR